MAKTPMIGRSQLTMKIPGRGGTGVSPVNDEQDARPTKTGQSPEDRHSQAGAWEREVKAVLIP